MDVTVKTRSVWPNVGMTSKPFPSPIRSAIVHSARLAAFAVAFGAVSTVQAQAVGEATMTIGQAIVVSVSGESSPVQRGSKILVGDRIETAAGGHVHIRFVDGALISLRPTSRLIVEDYQYDPAKASQSLVRFRLEKGVTRAISGAAAEGARDRFRLNTPLVAIGVRGTDFVVSTGPGRTVAAVNQGAIVMAPFGEGCSAQALGPCGSPAAKLLSADMSNTLVEFKNTLAQVEFKLFNGGKSPETLLASVQSPAKDAGVHPELGSRPSASAGGDALTSGLVSEAVQIGSNIRVIAPPLQTAQAPDLMPFLPIDPVVLLPAVVSPPPAPVVVAVVAPPPLVSVVVPVVVALPVLPTAPLPPAQLAWGRWSAEALAATDFSQPRLQATAGRSITVGDDNFLLYRNENSIAALAPGVNNLSFALERGHAQFTSPTRQVLPALVNSGSLSINFAENLFNTSLSLSSVPTGNVMLQATGSVRSDGIFTSRSSTQAVAGALALDGLSAGYLFEKAAAGGTLSGITLWSR